MEHTKHVAQLNPKPDILHDVFPQPALFCMLVLPPSSVMKRVPLHPTRSLDECAPAHKSYRQSVTRVVGARTQTYPLTLCTRWQYR